MKTITVCHCGSPRVFQDAAVNVNTQAVSIHDSSSCSDCSYDGSQFYQVEVPDRFDLSTETVKTLEFVVRIGGMPGVCYLTQPGDEDEPSELICTSDPVLASRFASKGKAQSALDLAVKLHPSIAFCIGAVSLVAA